MDGEFTIARQAQELVERCGSYTEITPSQRGLRIIGYGNGEHVHSEFLVDDWSLEIYRKASRYICMTGAPLPGYGRELCNIDVVIDQVRRPGTVPALPASFASQAPSPACDCSEDDLDSWILDFVQRGVPQGQRSSFFQLIINNLYREGWPLDQVEALFERYPDGLAARYRGRLSKEVARSLQKADNEVRFGSR